MRSHTPTKRSRKPEPRRNVSLCSSGNAMKCLLHTTELTTEAHLQDGSSAPARARDVWPTLRGWPGLRSTGIRSFPLALPSSPHRGLHPRASLINPLYLSLGCLSSVLRLSWKRALHRGRGTSSASEWHAVASHNAV